MLHHTRFLLTTIALAALTATAVHAQVTPPTPNGAPATMAPDEPGAQTTPTAGPATTSPATAAPATSAPQQPVRAKTNSGKHTGKVKKLKEATLTASQIKYAFTHLKQTADSLRKMHTVDFNKIRIVRASKLNVHAYIDGFAQPVTVAQTGITFPTINGSNSPLQYLQDVLANVTVSNALNNTLNNSTLNLNVSLSDVLNGNNIAIGQVVGVYVGGGGIINTVIK